MSPVLPTRKTSLSVLLTHISDVPWTDSYAGSPLRRMSSAGVVLTKTVGAFEVEYFLPGTASFTSFQFSSAGSFLKLSGRSPAGCQPPIRSVVFIHDLSLRR